MNGGHRRARPWLNWRHAAPLRYLGIAAVRGGGEARGDFVAEGFGGDDRIDDEFAREVFDVDVVAVLALQSGLGFGAFFVAQVLQLVK